MPVCSGIAEEELSSSEVNRVAGWPPCCGRRRINQWMVGRTDARANSDEHRPWVCLQKVRSRRSSEESAVDRSLVRDERATSPIARSSSATPQPRCLHVDVGLGQEHTGRQAVGTQVKWQISRSRCCTQATKALLNTKQKITTKEEC